MAIADSVRREHILKAIAHIKEKGIPAKHESHKFDLLYNRRRFPPKYVLAIANTFVDANARFRRSRGGKRTNDFLISREFTIVRKDGTSVSAHTNRQPPSSKGRGSTPQSVTLDKARKKALEEGAFDPQNDEDARDRAAALIVRRQGQPAFRKKLLKAYNNRCAISHCDCPDALEAAHIRPYKGKHTNHIKNGILLRSDIHTLVDLGRIRIYSNYKVGICADLQSSVYKEFHDKRLVLPKEKKDWPDCSGLT